MSDQNSNPANYFTELSNRFASIENQISNGNKISNISLNLIATVKDLLLHQFTTELQASHPNPLNKFGQKCFSQTDEDGITMEIIRRLGIENGVFAEFGVQGGIECNTLILGALGWRGFWVGGEKIVIDTSKTARLDFYKDWITLGNIVDHVEAGLKAMDVSELDLISLDLDENDIYLVDEILTKGHCPKIFIVEYNGKFLPPARFQIKYDDNHRWQGDDYFGAALANFVDMFSRHNYTLVCCNSHSGANAFFVRNEFLPYFDDVPKDINSIYVPPRYHVFSRYGHRVSPKVVETLFSDAL